MRILFAFPRLSYSGAPKMMSWIANQMAQRGHEVHFVTFFSEEQARVLHERVTFHSLNIHRSGSRLVRNTTEMLKAVCRLHKLIKQVSPDVMVSFLDSVGCVYLPIGRWLTNCRFVVSERADPYARHGVTARLLYSLMRFAHGIVFQTQGAQKFFGNNTAIFRCSTVIPNPVVVNDSVKRMQAMIPAVGERDHRIVTVGRLSLKQKRQDVLLEAFMLFRQSHRDYELVIYGDGPDKKRIQDLIDKMNMSDHVTLAGRTDEVEKAIFRSAAFVLTSDYEGIPNALIEALSLGVPSVSTDCSPGGAALLLRNEENGFLVPRGDAAAIAEKLTVLVEQAAVAERFSRNGPFVAERFAEAVIADKWETYFDDMMKRGGCQSE